MINADASDMIQELIGMDVSIIESCGCQRFSEIQDAFWDNEDETFCIDLLTMVDGEIKRDFMLELDYTSAWKLLSREVLYIEESETAVTSIMLVAGDGSLAKQVEERHSTEFSGLIEAMKGGHISIGFDELGIIFTVKEAVLVEDEEGFTMVRMDFTNQKAINIRMIDLKLLHEKGECYYHDVERDEDYVVKLIRH